MKNPFDNEDLCFFVLINDEGQHSLWPEFIKVPAGWRCTFGPEQRQQCINYINNNWHDIRPKSLSN